MSTETANPPLSGEITDLATVIRSSSSELADVISTIVSSISPNDVSLGTPRRAFGALGAVEYLAGCLRDNCNLLAGLVGAPDEGAQ